VRGALAVAVAAELCVTRCSGVRSSTATAASSLAAQWPSWAGATTAPTCDGSKRCIVRWVKKLSVVPVEWGAWAEVEGVDAGCMTERFVLNRLLDCAFCLLKHLFYEGPAAGGQA
jgi:hypothetical protein